MYALSATHQLQVQHLHGPSHEHMPTCGRILCQGYEVLSSIMSATDTYFEHLTLHLNLPIGTVVGYALASCFWQELRRLHLYVQQNDSEETVLEDKCLQRLPLRHVSILLGDLCDKFHIVPLLNALPDTVTSVCVAGPFHAALKLGQDGSGQVGGLGVGYDG